MLCCAVLSWGDLTQSISLLAVQVMEEEMGGVVEQQQEVRRAMQDVQFSRRLDEQQRQLQQQRLDDAEARLRKARLLVQGPILPKVSIQTSSTKLQQALLTLSAMLLPSFAWLKCFAPARPGCSFPFGCKLLGLKLC